MRFPLSCLARRGGKRSRDLLARSRDFERPERAPRSPAGTHTCAVAYALPPCPCVPRSREREEGPTVGRAGHANVKKESVCVSYRHNAVDYRTYLLLNFSCFPFRYTHLARTYIQQLSQNEHRNRRSGLFFKLAF